MAARSRIFLLRTPRTPDPYRQVFERGGYRVDVVPVLRFEYIHRNALREVLTRTELFEGIITTSPRAVEALRAQRDLVRAWTSSAFYAAGPETARRARKLGFSPRGEEAGSAEDLADLIIENSPDRPLLFLSGNRRRDTLPDRLNTAGVSFEELVVYETHTRGTLDWPEWDEDQPAWVVFFSPSGIEAARRDPTIVWNAVRKAAIGSTTADALRAAGWTVDAVADAPTPEALCRAIRQASAD